MRVPALRPNQAFRFQAFTSATGAVPRSVETLRALELICDDGTGQIVLTEEGVAGTGQRRLYRRTLTEMAQP
jgi:hypothetical protein